MKPKPHGFPKSTHLCRPAEFQAVYARRCKASDANLLIFAAPNSLGETRLGLSVSKKHGSAVQRNRLKRLLREAFRLSRPDLPQGVDLVVIPRENRVATLQEYQQSLCQIVPRLARRLAAPTPQ